MPTKTSPDPKKPKAPRKPRGAAVKKKEPAVKAIAKEHHLPKVDEVKVHEPKPEKHHAAPGKYIFATGRRKTAVANVRLFSGKGDSVVNKKPLNEYFQYSYYQQEIGKPFQLTGLEDKHHFTSHINGGGPHSQAQALQYGLSIALGMISPEIRKLLKKNGLLTRDDRKKERKNPGLKRARRSPQWAKR